MTSRTLDLAGRSVMVRDAGEPEGSPLLYFHGSPGSRLDVAFGDDVATALGVRVVSFDRPGHGGSDPVPYGLTAVARDAEAIADHLGLERLAVLGWSGGGPFALASSALLEDRITQVGVASGPAPFQELPGALDLLGDSDRVALSFLPEDPARAAAAFRTGSEAMVAAVGDEEAFLAGLDALLAESDGDVLADPRLRSHLYSMLREGLRQGFTGVGWDNVAWVGPWDVDLAAIRCPVHLWYGELDPMVPLAHGRWLAEHLPGSELVVYEGEGHLGPMRHWREVLTTLTAAP